MKTQEQEKYEAASEIAVLIERIASLTHQVMLWEKRYHAVMNGALESELMKPAVPIILQNNREILEKLEDALLKSKIAMEGDPVFYGNVLDSVRLALRELEDWRKNEIV